MNPFIDNKVEASRPGTPATSSSSSKYALEDGVAVVKSSGCGCSFFPRHKQRKSRTDYILEIIRGNKVTPQ